MSSALRIINIQLRQRLGLGLGLILLLLLTLSQVGEARTMPWMNYNEASYDASLDPLVWSRPFVQDTVRRHRTAPQLNHYHHQLHHRQRPCPELFKRRRQQTFKWSKKLRLNGGGNTIYKKYLHRRRKLMLQTRC